MLSSSESSKSWTPLSSRSWRLPSSRTGQPGVDVGDGVRLASVKAALLALAAESASASLMSRASGLGQAREAVKAWALG